MSEDLRVIKSDPAHRVALWGDVVLALFRAGPTEGRIVTGWELAMREQKKSGNKALFFGVIEVESEPPADAARLALSRFFESHASQIAAFVATVEGTGFRAAMGRTIVTAVMSLSPRFRLPFPRHVASSVEEGAVLGAKAMPRLDTTGLLEALKALRAHAG